MSRLPMANHRFAAQAVLLGPAGPVRAAPFFAQAARLARALPESGYVLNLCETRHGFMLGFAAALLRGQVSLLPPGRGRSDWEMLPRRYPGTYVLCERPVAGARAFEIGDFLDERPAGGLEIPAIDSGAPAAILFTSGSTGEPSAHPKSWGQLCRGAFLLGEALGWQRTPAQAIVGSVPPQHMFGLESTVLLPWQWGLPIHAHVPLLAADLESALRDCGVPAWWMTTPMHLRAPLQSGERLAGLEGVVSSTMSLPAVLAGAAEAAWRIPVIELYGSTETGALATRRTACEALWTPLRGVALQARGTGEARRFHVDGPHIDPPVMLGDLLDMHSDGRFRWLGRAADLVKIGGKRASLSALNLALTQVPGVADGVFSFAPPAPAGQDESLPPRRLAAFYVSESLRPAQVLAALRTQLDPAFLPRPLHRVASLPRNANGKLTLAALDALFAQFQESQAIMADHPALPGHFPGAPLVPGVTLLARVAEALRARYPRCVPGELRHARFHDPLRPGEAFAIEVRLREGHARFEVRRAADAGAPGAMIASGEWLLRDSEAAAPRP